MTLTLGQFRPAGAPPVPSSPRETKSVSPGADAFGSIMDDTLAGRPDAPSTPVSTESTGDHARDSAAGASSTASPARPDSAIPVVPVSFSAALTLAGDGAAAPSVTATDTVAVDGTAHSGTSASGAGWSVLDTMAPPTTAAAALAAGAGTLEAAAGLAASNIPAAVAPIPALPIPALPGTAVSTTAAASPRGGAAAAAGPTATAFASVVTATAPGTAGKAAATGVGSTGPAAGASDATGDATVLSALPTSATAGAAILAGAPGLPGAAQAGAAQNTAVAGTGTAGSALPDSIRLTGRGAGAEAVAPSTPAVPTSVPIAMSTPTATLVAAPASVTALPLTAQIMKPLFSLATAAPGEHVLTISVSPDNLGPVTVRAHVTGEGIRVELFAPTDLAREALRVILPDLRRDLAGSGLSAQLDLSSDSQAGDPSATRQPRSEADGRDPDARGPAERAPDTPQEQRPPQFGSTHTIDVLA
ncbi:flagellar hook-length control protein FliK [Cryobacterium suzukii]|uniref:Flagellar hook-length control protein FliK n=1 Tax=Cryobacterium suzukii TaxID=1259198 RepID=A0A4R9AGZ0_9MICO|nr:flagellar hook-length control protein FliK [Cryobacterium suzukii]